MVFATRLWCLCVCCNVPRTTITVDSHRPLDSAAEKNGSRHGWGIECREHAPTKHQCSGTTVIKRKSIESCSLLCYLSHYRPKKHSQITIVFYRSTETASFCKTQIFISFKTKRELRNLSITMRPRITNKTFNQTTSSRIPGFDHLRIYSCYGMTKIGAASNAVCQESEKIIGAALCLDGAICLMYDGEWSVRLNDYSLQLYTVACR